MTLTDRDGILAECAAATQPRSEFQIRSWVLGQHDTDPKRFEQLCLELSTALYGYRVTLLRLRASEAEVARLGARRRGVLRRRDEAARLEAEIKAVEVAQTRAALVGVERELAVLLRLWDEVPHFSREQIEADQPEYWRRRLTRETTLQIVAGGANWSHLDAMQQADPTWIARFVAGVERAERAAVAGDVSRERALLEPPRLNGAG